VRDGIQLARRKIPTTCLLTEKFAKQGEFTSRAAGMPDIPKVILPHPVAGSGIENIRRVAEEIFDRVRSSLERGAK
jgi:hypothetical protein